MKRLFACLAVVIIGLSLSSCGIFDRDPDASGLLQNLTVTKVTGDIQEVTDLSFSKCNYYPHPSDVPGCAQVIATTDGKRVYDYIMLSFCFYDTTSIGEELKLERLNFGTPLSSDSRDYTGTFTGKMILKEKSGNKAVIRMEDVHFKIARGEYILNGDLVATK